MEQSSKELVRGLFQMRDLSRVPFVPWVGSFAAQLEQIETEDMLSDAGLLSTSLTNAQKLFGYDAIINVFDPTLEAEACGCRIDWGEDGGSPRVVSHPLGEGTTIDDLDMSNFEGQGTGSSGSDQEIEHHERKTGGHRGRDYCTFDTGETPER